MGGAANVPFRRAAIPHGLARTMDDDFESILDDRDFESAGYYFMNGDFVSIWHDFVCADLGSIITAL